MWAGRKTCSEREATTEMKILVTGADGFIGSHLVEYLVLQGHDVRAFCFYNSNGSLGWLDKSESIGNFEPVLGDVRDVEFALQACRDVDVVLHLAALIAIPYSYVAPRSYVDTNVLGTLNLLEGCRKAECRLVVASTSEVYGTPESVPIREDHPLQGQSPYSATKIAADQLSLSYARSFETEVSILRPFNTYGPRQSMRAVIPTILTQLLSGAERIRLGSLSPMRDFTYVSDTVLGFAEAASQGLPRGSVTQLGTGESVSIGDLVVAAQQVTGREAEVIADDDRVRPKESEVEVLLSDPTLAGERLSWSPHISLLEGLRLTAQWIGQFGDLERASEYRR